MVFAEQRGPKRLEHLRKTSSQGLSSKATGGATETKESPGQLVGNPDVC